MKYHMECCQLQENKLTIWIIVLPANENRQNFKNYMEQNYAQT